MTTSKETRISNGVKKGVGIIVAGVIIVVIGASLATNEQPVMMIVGWGLDIVGVVLGLYGFGYTVAVLKKRH